MQQPAPAARTEDNRIASRNTSGALMTLIIGIFTPVRGTGIRLFPSRYRKSLADY